MDLVVDTRGQRQTNNKGVRNISVQGVPVGGDSEDKRVHQ